MRIREIAIGAALSGLLAAVVVLTLPTSEPLRVTAPAPVASALPIAAPAPRGARTAVTPPGAAQGATTRWRDMDASFQRARNLREFFYERMRKPDDDAIHYAMQALELCGRVLAQDGDALPPARRQAASELQRRCDFTREGLQDAQRQVRAARHPDPDQDTAMQTLSNYLAADGAGGRAAVLSAAFAQGDPTTISLLATAAVVQNLPAPAAGDMDANARVAPFGHLLVGCRLGAECGPGAIRTLDLCMRFGLCADSVPAALQQGLGRHFALLDKVATQVAQDLSRP
ncbi:hypothetical protein [Massilia sp. 9I]|uniref:hypothetical protein n=1 Tax=Massilia sp. 9I TaxID=2653152 RepID=UPI0012F25BFD|nr:hypothetical protein [Massilia sp. 9I]VXC60550.1 conserved hypothetical protein [Massilia sp. 9I]